MARNCALDPDSRFRKSDSDDWIDYDCFADRDDSECHITSGTSSNGEPFFYPVSSKKFVLMSVTTLGGYYFFWVIKNLRYLSRSVDTTGLIVNVVLFPFIAGFGLLGAIHSQIDEYLSVNNKTNYNLASIMTMQSQLFIAMFFAFMPQLRILLLAPLLHPFFLLPVIRRINYVNELKGAGDCIDDSISLLNRIWFVLFFVGLIIFVGFLYT
jgi:hypothetical protein